MNSRNLPILAFILLVLAGGSAVTAQADPNLLELQAVVPEKYISTSPRQKVISTHTSQLHPFIKRKISGVTYAIAYSAKTREVVYVHTKDKAFRTRSGLKVGDELTVKKEDFHVIPHVEIRGRETEDGWEPVFGYEWESAENKPNLVDRLKPGESLKLKILAFSKGGN